MKEFINEYPLFSYIAVPVLFVALLMLTYIVLKPSGQIKNYFSKLYFLVLEAIDFVSNEQKSFSREKLKQLLKMLEKMRHCYEQLESEELYEVEGIIKNIDKAASITRALLAAKSNEQVVLDYLLDIASEIKAVKISLYSFSLSREDKEFTVIDTLGIKRSKEKAAEYLKSIKNTK